MSFSDRRKGWQGGRGVEAKCDGAKFLWPDALHVANNMSTLLQRLSSLLSVSTRYTVLTYILLSLQEN